MSFHSDLQELVKAGCCKYHGVSCWGYKTKNRRKDSGDPPLCRAENVPECLAIFWYLGYNVGGRKKTMKFLQHIPLQWSVQGTPFVPRLWQLFLWQPRKFCLERDGFVRRICCILATASLWARNAVRQTAGEEHLLAVLWVGTEVLRWLRGLEWELQCAWS